VILDEGERWLFRAIVLVSLFFVARGHNAPGGGFIGGLVAGAAFALRLLAGRRSEGEVCGRLRPAVLVSIGALVAVLTAVTPLAFGGALLESAIWKLDLPLFGSVKVVSAAVFDVGVFMLVLGVVLTVLLQLVDTDEPLHDEMPHHAGQPQAAESEPA
jgi:multisubunit Na+/H+ antiporter MnhB subunit